MSQKSSRATVRRIFGLSLFIFLMIISLVPSRYRSATQELPCNLSTTASRGGPSTSSPKKDQRTFLDIHDSIASIIRSEAEPSLASKPVLRLQRCRSMSDIGRTRLNLTDSEIKLRSNLATWTFLLEHSRKALEKQNKQEEALCKAIAEAHDREAWLKKWLKVQEAIDLQIVIYQRLLKLMEGESGIISLLRRLYDNHLLPVSDRLPLEGLTLGDDFQARLTAASLAQENAEFNSAAKIQRLLAMCAIHSKCLQRELPAGIAGDLKALSAIASQLDELAHVVLSSTSWLGNKEVVAKLTQACRLCLHLASLRTHRLQQEMAQRVGAISS